MPCMSRARVRAFGLPEAAPGSAGTRTSQRWEMPVIDVAPYALLVVSCLALVYSLSG
jgi:hypothetical protein